MGISNDIRALIRDDELDAIAAADSVLASAPSDRGDLLDYLRPLVVSEARRIARSRTRHIEDRAFTPPSSSATSGWGEAPMTSADAKKLLVQEHVFLPDGRVVRWDEMTAADHRLRATWQRGRAGSLVRDAERHEVAAKLIEDRGVETLGEIDDWPSLIVDLLP